MKSINKYTAVPSGGKHNNNNSTRYHHLMLMITRQMLVLGILLHVVTTLPRAVDSFTAHSTTKIVSIIRPHSTTSVHNHVMFNKSSLCLFADKPCSSLSSSTLLAKTTSQDASLSSSSTGGNHENMFAAMASTASLIALDIFFRRLFKAFSISFPSALGGCGILFATMIGLYSLDPSLGDAVYRVLSPGAAVLAKWLPVFFVPSLITLPLAQSLGSSLEVSQ